MDQLEKMPPTVESLQRELAQTRAKLEKSELLFQSILESSLAGYWIWNLKDNSLFLSPTFKSMFGYNEEELADSLDTINALMFDQDLPRAHANMEEHIESNGKIPYKCEVRYHHKDGSTVWVICTGSILEKDENGAPRTFLGCHININHLKKSEELTKYTKELEIKNHEMEQFAYVASHDLQEPLNTIRGVVSLLEVRLKDNQDEEVEQCLDFLNQGAGRMSDLIKGLLDYSRLGKESVITDVNCQVIADGIVDDHKALIDETKAKILVSELPVVKGLETELHVVFQNLIGNALKYIGKDAPRIEIDATEQETHWKFSIRDNGIGIQPGDRNKIFKLYQRLHKKQAYEGSGLGLAHCQKIIEELHHGKIWVGGNSPQGSIFYFTIPKI
ncbi:MAG: PAS domain-containing protein [Reichenbachiella sp.]